MKPSVTVHALPAGALVVCTDVYFETDEEREEFLGSLRELAGPDGRVAVIWLDSARQEPLARIDTPATIREAMRRDY